MEVTQEVTAPHFVMSFTNLEVVEVNVTTFATTCTRHSKYQHMICQGASTSAEMMKGVTAMEVMEEVPAVEVAEEVTAMEVMQEVTAPHFVMSFVNLELVEVNVMTFATTCTRHSEYQYVICQSASTSA